MNHEPYETWLCSAESLSADQALALSKHLETCEACQQLGASWNEAESLFRNSIPASPVPEFTNRWLSRLASRRSLEQQQKMRRLTWWFFALAFTCAIISFVLSMTQILPIFDSPLDFFIAGIYLVSSLISATSALQEFVVTFLRVILQTIPPYWLAGFLFIAGMLCLSWIVLLRRLLLPRRLLS
jgi:anti-sigma factor RsiW